MTGLPLFSGKKMTGPRLFWGLKISHFPLCRTINFAPSLIARNDADTGKRALCSVLSGKIDVQYLIWFVEFYLNLPNCAVLFFALSSAPSG